MTWSTSDVAACCPRASLSSRVSRAISPCSLATEEVMRVACFDALPDLNFGAFGRRALERWPLTLERLFIGFPVGWRILAGLVGTLKVGPWPSDGLLAVALAFNGRDGRVGPSDAIALPKRRETRAR